MNAVNIFEEATKNKLRFASTRGELSVEDLWDLNLKSTKNTFDLDNVAKGISRELKALDEESFVERSSNPQRDTLTIKLEVVKAVIARKQADNAAALATADKAARKRVLLEALNNKQSQALEGMSVEQIEAELAQLDGRSAPKAATETTAPASVEA